MEFAMSADIANSIAALDQYLAAAIDKQWRTPHRVCVRPPQIDALRIEVR